MKTLASSPPVPVEEAAQDMIEHSRSNNDEVPSARRPGTHTQAETACTCMRSDENCSPGQAGSDYTKTPDRSNIPAFLTFASIWDTRLVQNFSRGLCNGRSRQK